MKIREFDQLCKKLMTITSAAAYCRAAQDDQAVNRLSDASGLNLVCVMPMRGFSGKLDAVKRHYTFTVYALEKDDDGQSFESELDQYERTEEAILKIFDYLTGEDSGVTCVPYPDININGITIDPEYRTFGGWNGYSLTVSV